MKFKLKLLIIIFAFTQFQNSVYSAEILKNTVKFIKEIPKNILADKKLYRDILKTAVIVIPITILFIKLTKRTKYVYVYRHGDDCGCGDCRIPGGLQHYM